MIYDENNYKKAKGTTFLYMENNKVKTCFVANVDFSIGITIKDMDETDPDKHIYCYRSEESIGNESNPELDVPAILKRLNYFSEIENNGKIISNEDLEESFNYISMGTSSCPF